MATAVGAVALVVAACGGGDPTATPEPTRAPTGGLTYQAAAGSRVVDGAAAGWTGVPVLRVPLKSLDGRWKWTCRSRSTRA